MYALSPPALTLADRLGRSTRAGFRDGQDGQASRAVQDNRSPIGLKILGLFDALGRQRFG